MKEINTVHKTVATMANQLHKLGYTLSQAFKTVWKRVKCQEFHEMQSVRRYIRETAVVIAIHSR